MPLVIFVLSGVHKQKKTLSYEISDNTRPHENIQGDCLNPIVTREKSTKHVNT